jgi:acetyltransferase
MTIRNLDHALRPGSVALFGATEREGSVGRVIMRNLLEGGFEGPVWPVNPKHREVMGRPCVARAAELPQAPDLAVIATPPRSVPGIIADLGEKGTRVAVVITAGLGADVGQRMLNAARPHLLRVIGPNTLGLMVPPLGLNATFAHMGARPGNLALLSQSGAIATALVDWAAEHGIGFSHIVSLGNMADVDVGDYLDLLAGDGRTRAILMYLETIPHARKFLSAARAAARLKPVIALKSGRHAEAAVAAATHSGALSGVDDVVEAALRRAGIVRVRGLAEMFDAAETMARFRPLERGRLGIVTNGGGAGVLAVDRLMDSSGELAELAPETIAGLDAALPTTWSRANPVDIIGDAPPERYLAAIEAVARDVGVDAMLVMNCPTALASSEAAAAAVAERLDKGRLDGKPVITCWLGGQSARGARTILREAGAASYASPAAAAAAVGHLTDWGRAQAAMLRVPDRKMEAALAATPDDARQKVAEIFARVAADQRSVLTEPEAKAALAAYGMAVPEIRVAPDPVEAGDLAGDMLKTHRALVVKLVSREITHKSDVGGVVLDIGSAMEAEEAAQGIDKRVRGQRPDAVIDGFALQPMVRRDGAEELLLGVSRDSVFGPVIVFGAGGTAVETIRDTAIALPPLDAMLAGDLIERTRIGRVLAGYRGRPPADAAAIRGALIALSHMIEDFPCIRGIDVNPLLADAEGAVALDARIEIEPKDLARQGPNPDLAIRPYPAAWRRQVSLPGGRFEIRPIRPGDVLLYPDFLERLDPEALRLRFLAPRRHFTDETALRLTQLDYDRDMAFVALTDQGALAGVSRLAVDPDHRTAEYALIVRSDLQGGGLGTALMNILIDYARADGIRRLEGLVLGENTGMRALAKRLGFSEARELDSPELVRTVLTF